MTTDSTPPAEARTDLSEDALRAAIVADCRLSAIRRRALPGERVIETTTLLAYACDVQSPDVNEVVLARLGGPDAPDVDAAIDDTIRLFDGRPFLWWVCPDDEPADLGARLSAHGIVFLDEIPGMAMDLVELAGESEEPPPDELDIAPVLDPTALADFHSVLTHGFPEDWEDESAIGVIAGGNAIVAAEHHYREPNGVPTRWLGRVESRAVATARIHTAAGRGRRLHGDHGPGRPPPRLRGGDDASRAARRSRGRSADRDAAGVDRGPRDLRADRLPGALPVPAARVAPVAGIIDGNGRGRMEER